MNNQIIASYLRISVDNGDLSESESITGQRALIADYIQTHQDLKGAKHLEFCDDGYSGTNFNRPAVQELIKKVKTGEIDCIIVKDFSRFGRNYIEVSDYLEQIFPFLKVRFISVNDNYDSASQKYIAGNIKIAFQNLYNDYYSKDVSNKVKSSITALRESGKYLSNYAIFGYEKSKDDKHKLVIDEKAAVVVRQIFEMAISGKTTSEIAVELNNKGILSPTAYKKSKGIYHNRKTLYDNNMWLGDKIASIIQDIRYTGAVVQGMYVKHFVGSVKSRKLPREQWSIYPNQHEPIISKEEQEKAIQNCLKKQSVNKNVTDKIRLTNSLSQIKIRCGGCGYSLNRPTHKDGIALYCKKKNSLNSHCFKGSIRLDIIEYAVLVAVQNLLSVYSSDNETVENQKQSSSVDLFAEISKIRKEIARINNEKLNAYKKYSDGDITREQYIKERETANIQIDQLSLQAAVLEDEYEQKQKNTMPPSPVTELLFDIKAIENLTPDIVSTLIDCIYVYDKNRIEIKWSFIDPSINKS